VVTQLEGSDRVSAFNQVVEHLRGECRCAVHPF
jgi:hypothetical protein